jgi:hypothetical protein
MGTNIGQRLGANFLYVLFPLVPETRSTENECGFAQGHPNGGWLAGRVPTPKFPIQRLLQQMDGVAGECGRSTGGREREGEGEGDEGRVNSVCGGRRAEEGGGIISRIGAVVIFN